MSKYKGNRFQAIIILNLKAHIKDTPTNNFTFIPKSCPPHPTKQSQKEKQKDKYLYQCTDA